MHKIDINCDVGEGLNNELDLMPFIQSCNIACGAHAGNIDIMKNVVRLAGKFKVKIGAHPSYPDKRNFGRVSMKIRDEELIESIQSQINLLARIVEEEQFKMHHIKPHGALYNDIAKDVKMALLFLKAILPFKEKMKLFVPYNSEIAKEAENQGFQIIYEAFADRNYNSDLSLVSRLEKDAVLTNVEQIINHINSIVNNEEVITISGEIKSLKATTFCVHSDTDNALNIVKNIYKKYNS